LGGDGADSLVAGSIGAYLNGGDGADSLVGGAGSDTFAYTGGDDTIKDYTAGQDLVSVAAGIDVAGAKVESVESANGTNLVLGFDNGNSLTFEGGSAKTISLKSGRRDYLFAASSIVSGNSITLTAGYTASSFEGGSTYDTIDASAVSLSSSGISITGNDNGNYIAIGKSGGSLFGGSGNDTLVGGDKEDIFRYTAGKDVIVGFDGTGDSLTIDDTAIAKARESSRRLTFTMTDKNNTLVFRSDDSIPAQISLTGGGYLTTDGVVKGNSLKLFSSAKGRIDYGTGVTSINASAVDKQSVTLVGGASGGTFIFATNGNKKRDGFEYGGGSATITNYESGKDRINLLNESIAGFSIVNSDDVMISLSSSDSNKFISLEGAQGSEVLIHQSTNRGNSYSKMVFADTGVVYDKAKATSATLSTGAVSFAVDDKDNVKSTLRKIIVGAGAKDISITAGSSKNTVIDASNASGAVSLISGAKNDKFTGSAFADMFVYTKGKDILQDFNIGDATDQISLNGSDLKLEDAKITANKKSIKFKFGTKDVLTVKPTKNDTLSGELNINGDTRTYGKNSIADSGNVSLTSKFGGTYNIDKSGGSTIDGGLVS
ncbi:MAG: hypothetical protein IJP68_09200, partial [Selenomonadaceae bacterium]|nr:hypothetical protein [Selenomonadaceae bacterium]